MLNAKAIYLINFINIYFLNMPSISRVFEEIYFMKFLLIFLTDILPNIYSGNSSIKLNVTQTNISKKFPKIKTCIQFLDLIKTFLNSNFWYILTSIYLLIFLIPSAYSIELKPITKIISTPLQEKAYGICNSDSDGFYIGGIKTINAFTSALILKLDEHLEIEWEYTYSCNANILLLGIDKTEDGGCIGVGSVPGTCAGLGPSMAALAIRLYSDKSEKWVKFYNPFVFGNVWGVKTMSNGDFSIVGSASLRPFAFNIGPNGNLKWYDFRTEAKQSFQRSEETQDHDIIAVGSESSACLFVRYGPNGNQIIAQGSFPGGNDFAKCFGIRRIRETNYFLLTGSVDIGSPIQRDGYIAKVTQDAVILWEKQFGDESSERAFSVNFMKYNGFIAGCGDKVRINGINRMMWLFLLDQDGNLMESRYYGDTINESFSYDIAIHKNGNLVTSGRISSNSADISIVVDQFGCNEGAFLSTDTNLCEYCQAGFMQPIAGSAYCEPCYKGYYQSVKGMAECYKCPIHFYQPEAGKSACIKCPKGQWQDLEGQVFCNECDAGFYYEFSTKSCEKCNELCKKCEGPNVDECTECIPSKSLTVENEKICTVRCSEGYYRSDNICKSIFEI